MKIIQQLSLVLLFLSLLFLSTTSWAEQSRLDLISERGYIVVGTTGDYKPFSYYNEEIKEFEGHDIDAAAKLPHPQGRDVTVLPAVADAEGSGGRLTEIM